MTSDSDVLNSPEFREASRKVGAMYDVTDRLKLRAATKPSQSVIRKACGIHAAGGKIAVSVHQCKLYHVDSESGNGQRYMVVLSVEWKRDNAGYEIIDGECSCTAGRNGKHCAHLLAVLASEAYHGNHLKT